MPKEFKRCNNEILIYEIYQKLDKVREEQAELRSKIASGRKAFNEKYDRLDVLKFLEKHWIKELAKKMEISNPFDN